MATQLQKENVAGWVDVTETR